MCLNMVLFCFISLTAASVNELVVFIKFVKTLAVINSSIFLPHFHPLILTFKFNYIDELILSYRFLKFTAVFAHVCTCMWGPEINTGCLTLWDNVSHWTWSSLTQLGWPVSPRNLHLPSRSVVSHRVFGLHAGELSSWPYLCSKRFPVCAVPQALW